MKPLHAVFIGFSAVVVATLVRSALKSYLNFNI